MRCVENKARLTGGFTLAETLLSLLVLVVLAAIVTMGVPMAFAAYTTSVNASNAQTLLSTASVVLRDELGSASQVEVDSSGVVQYYLTSEGHWASLDVQGTNGDMRIVRHDYLGVPGSGTFEDAPDSPHPLVSKPVADNSIGLAFNNVKYANGVFTVTGLRVVDHAGQTAASISVDGGDFRIKALVLEEEG